MSKNLVLFCNGTGNVKDFGPDTNVERLYQRALGYKDATPGQISCYQNGVGIEFGDLIGRAFGQGISQNIKDGYDFIAKHYDVGDRIFLFGFSRGAYSARSIGGMLGRVGLPRRRADDDVDLRIDEEARLELVARAYAIYKIADRDERVRQAAAFRKAHGYPAHEVEAARAPHLIGVWDTVRSLGIPLGVKDYELSFWPHRFHDHDLNPDVAHAYHALSIDEEREQFLPTIWNEPTKAELRAIEQGTPNRQHFKQVWFPGVHSDVGGGYEKHALADVTLRWMIELAAEAGLLFEPAYAADPARDLSDSAPEGQVNDSRETAWKRFLYPRHPRQIVRGTQEPDQKDIVAIGPGRLSREALDRVVRWHGTPAEYNPESLRTHPDYLTALEQLGSGKTALTGPFPDTE